MNYQIIKDKKAFKDFIDWLPELKDGEQFYYTLFARSKYDLTGTLKSDKSQLGRGVTTKERLYGKIKKLEVELGTYEISGVTVPENTLALYIHPNPRSMKTASLKTAKMILDNIEKDRYQNPKSIALNALQVSKSRTVWIDFDIDNKDIPKEFLFKKLTSILGGAEYKIVETRGGYHVLIRPDTVEYKLKNTWYQNITRLDNIDQKGDLLLPVPGCVQGDFIPKFINGA